MLVCAGAGHGAERAWEEEFRRAAGRVFDQAVYLKPERTALSGVEGAFAPLVVREVVGDGDMSPVPPRGGGGCDARTFAYPRWLEGRAAGWREAEATPGAVTVEGVTYAQVTYAWHLKPRRTPPPLKGWAPRPEPRRETSKHRNAGTGAERNVETEEGGWVGVRITVGSDGFGVVWEVLDARAPEVVLYVSRSAESLAERQFGVALPGRRFAIERSVTEAPEVVVVRALEDGPAPMGPYVYVDDADRIISVLCRCSPAQVEAFALEGTYTARGGAEAGRWGVVDFGSVLRWPEGL